MSTEDAARGFALEVTGVVGTLLGDTRYGVYLGGSLALGDFVPGQSDVDLAVVAGRSLGAGRQEALVAALEPAARRCPTRGLELVVYSRADAASPSWPPRFELNFNAGPRMRLNVSYDPVSEPAHWFAIDLAVLRERGVPLAGPPAAETFGCIRRERLLVALADSLAWHKSNEPRSPSTVLNACRAWRFAQEGVWSSKAEAAGWARSRLGQATLIDAALEARRTGGALDPSDVRALTARASEAVAACATSS
jgi:hypothetical protein